MTGRLSPEAWMAWIPVFTRLLGLLGAFWEILGVDFVGKERSWQAIVLIGAMLGIGEFVHAIRPPWNPPGEP
jgi:hypothetical protein